MLIGAHAIIYSKSPDADRAFLRDVLKLPNVDVGQETRFPARRSVRLQTDGKVPEATVADKSFLARDYRGQPEVFANDAGGVFDDRRRRSLPPRASLGLVLGLIRQALTPWRT